MNRKQLKALLVLVAAVGLGPSLPVSAGHNVPNTPHSDEESLYPSPVVLQGRRHPSYQVFAYQMQLPPIAILGNRILIDRTISIDGTRLHRLSWRPRQAMAFKFAVPMAVIEHWRENLLRQEPLNAQALAGDLCATVIDYHYLKVRWLQYRPPSASMEQFKAEALHALEAGELNQAWEMYYSLSRPPAPTW